MTKRIALFMSVVMLAATLFGCTIVDNTIVAKVNGEAIKKGEYQYYLENAKNSIQSTANTANDPNFWTTGQIEGKNAADAAKDKALTDVVDATVIAQKGKEMGIVIDAKAKQEIGKQKASIIQNNGGRTKYEEYIKTYGLTDEDFGVLLEKSYLTQKLWDKLKTTGPQPTDEEIKAYYQNNIIRAKHILMSKVNEDGTEKDEAGKAAAKKQAEDLLVKLKGGANFNKLMLELSEDPGTKTNPDGYTFGKGEMVPAFETAAFALKVGELSEIVETDFGYHIIRREDAMEKYSEYLEKQGNQGVTGKEQLINTSLQGKFDEMKKEWKAAATIEPNQKELAKIKVAATVTPAPAKK